MEEYESAKEAFEASEALSDQLSVRRWIRKCDAEIEEEEEAVPVVVKEDTTHSTRTPVEMKVDVAATTPAISMTVEEAFREPIVPVKSAVR